MAFTEQSIQPRDLFSQNARAIFSQNNPDQAPNAPDVKQKVGVSFDDSKGPEAKSEGLIGAFSSIAGPKKETGIDKVRLVDDAHSFGGMLRDKDNQIPIQPNETGTQTALRHISNTVGEATQKIGAMGILGQEMKENDQMRKEAQAKEELKLEQPAQPAPTQIPYMKLG